ncbi:MAG: hypothetical protein AABX51_04250 [Nanoarchaeota archaeon]
METERDPLEDLSSGSIPPNLIEPEPQEDISKNAILMLLVLTIFVSAAGTWIVLRATDNIQYPAFQPPQEDTVSNNNMGQAVLSIVRPGEGPFEKKQAKAVGYASLTIKNPSEEQNG